MKRSFIIAFLMIFCSVLSYGQQSFIDKFADMDGITSVYISKSMISLFPQGNTNVNGINIGNIADRIDNIKILSADEKDIIAKLRKETSDINPKNGYEELMKVREDGQKVTIYFNEKKKKKEFVLVVDDKDEFTIISIAGDLTLKEIQGIIQNAEDQDQINKGEDEIKNRLHLLS